MLPIRPISKSGGVSAMLGVELCSSVGRSGEFEQFRCNDEATMRSATADPFHVARADWIISFVANRLPTITS